MMLRRLLTHFWHDGRHTRRVLDAQALRRLQDRVAGSEARHSGEIRLCVEAALPLAAVRRGQGARDRAVALFGELGVWDTEHNNGVLVYLLLAERAIEIVADRGVTRLVPQAHWDGVVAAMREAFGAGRFEEGLSQAVDAVDAVLVRHFPIGPGGDNPNELSDAVLLR